jgi:hypothetical protein
MNLEKSQAPFLCFRPAVEVFFSQMIFFEKFHFLVNDFPPKNREIATENSFFKVFSSKWQKVVTKNEIKITAYVHVIGVFQQREENCYVFYFLYLL